MKKLLPVFGNQEGQKANFQPKIFLVDMQNFHIFSDIFSKFYVIFRIFVLFGQKFFSVTFFFDFLTSSVTKFSWILGLIP